jgi:hypothetical protein
MIGDDIMGATLHRCDRRSFFSTRLVRLFGVKVVFDEEEVFLFEIRFRIRYHSESRSVRAECPTPEIEGFAGTDGLAGSLRPDKIASRRGGVLVSLRSGHALEAQPAFVRPPRKVSCAFRGRID